MCAATNNVLVCAATNNNSDLLRGLKVDRQKSESKTTNTTYGANTYDKGNNNFYKRMKVKEGYTEKRRGHFIQFTVAQVLSKPGPRIRSKNSETHRTRKTHFCFFSKKNALMNHNLVKAEPLYCRTAGKKMDV